MRLMTRFNSSFLAIAVTVALAACGGGGGGGGSTGPIPGTPQPTATPAVLGNAAGRVLDLDNGNPIPGATVVIGNTTIVGATAPATLPGDDKTAATANDGTFTISNLNLGTRTYACGGTGSGDGYCTGTTVTNVAFIEIFTSDHITLHGYAKIAAGSNAIADLKVTKPTAADTARLAKVNQYRNTTNAPPASLDEYLTEGARFFVNYTPPTGAVEGTDPDQGPNGPNFSPNSRYHSRGGYLPNSDYENIGGGSCLGNGGSLTSPEDDFYIEGTTGGHYQHMMDPTHVLVGFAETTPTGTYNCFGAVEDYTTVPQ
jgi:hypothetical protein